MVTLLLVYPDIQVKEGIIALLVLGDKIGLLDIMVIEMHVFMNGWVHQRNAADTDFHIWEIKQEGP